MSTSPTRRRGLVVPLAVVALSTTGLAALTSGAFFTDSQALGGNTFTTGTVKLSASTPTTTELSTGAMAPGDAKVGTITVRNTGSLAQRYSVLSTVTGDTKGLAAALSTTVKTGVASCTGAGFDATGTTVYGPGTLGTTVGTKVVGDSAPGAQAGDRVLSAGATEDLCVRVALPTTAGNALQDATTTATFRFDAEQTVNNP